MARQVKKGREGRPRKYSSWCYRVEHHFLKFNALSNYPNRTTTPIPNALVYFEPQSRSSYYNLKYPSHFRATRNWRLLTRGKSKGVDRLEKIMLEIKAKLLRILLVLIIYCCAQSHPKRRVEYVSN